MTKDLKSYAAAAGMQGDFSMYSFRSGGAIMSSVSGRTFSLHHAEGVLEGSQHRLEIHALDEGCSPGFGITGNYQRDLRKRNSDISMNFL